MIEPFGDLPDEVQKLIDRANVDLQDLQGDINPKIAEIRSQAETQKVMLSETENQTFAGTTRNGFLKG